MVLQIKPARRGSRMPRTLGIIAVLCLAPVTARAVQNQPEQPASNVSTAAENPPARPETPAKPAAGNDKSGAPLSITHEYHLKEVDAAQAKLVFELATKALKQDVTFETKGNALVATFQSQEAKRVVDALVSALDGGSAPQQPPGQPDLPTPKNYTKAFRVADVEYIKSLLMQCIPKLQLKARVSVDPNSQTVLVSGSAKDIEAIEQLLFLLHAPSPPAKQAEQTQPAVRQDEIADLAPQAARQAPQIGGLLNLDLLQLALEINKARSEVETGQAEIADLERLVEKGVVSTTQYEVAFARKKAAERKLQTLAILTDRAIAAASSEAEMRRKHLERVTTLHGQHAVPFATVEQAHREVKQLEGYLATLQAILKKAVED